MNHLKIVPQPFALSLPSGCVHFTQLSRPVSHFLPTPTCLSVVTVSAVPLYPSCTWSWTWGTVRATCDSGMGIRAPLPWNPRSCIVLFYPNFFFGLSSNYCDLASLPKLHVTAHTLLYFPTIPVAFVPSITCSTNITIVLTIYIYTVKEPIQQHSIPLQQLVTMNCAEIPSPSNCHPLLLFTFRCQVQFISYSCWTRAFSWVC